MAESGRFEIAQQMAHHESARTTGLYDRRNDQLTLDEVEMLLHLAEGGPANCDAVKVLAQEKLGDLETRMESLRAMHDSLGQLIATCDRPKRRRECPLIEALGGVPIPSGEQR